MVPICSQPEKGTTIYEFCTDDVFTIEVIGKDLDSGVTNNISLVVSPKDDFASSPNVLVDSILNSVLPPILAMSHKRFKYTGVKFGVSTLKSLTGTSTRPIQDSVFRSRSVVGVAIGTVPPSRTPLRTKATGNQKILPDVLWNPPYLMGVDEYTADPFMQIYYLIGEYGSQDKNPEYPGDNSAASIKLVIPGKGPGVRFSFKGHNFSLTQRIETDKNMPGLLLNLRIGIAVNTCELLFAVRYKRNYCLIRDAIVEGVIITKKDKKEK